ncbi:hypothetical protein HHI36_003694 [Cryptolaemus montrouzieri]|uniref:Uncharacterized protein n=1 Tax=Cryptolaemus montrouzieri TaxID=559131 RepID=A0ABD2PE52_9CUCU
MNTSRKLISQIASRQFHCSGARCATQEQITARLQKLKKLQEHFQIEDGTPVYLKGGIGDKILFGITCILTAGGLVMCGDLIYRLTNKD